MIPCYRKCSSQYLSDKQTLEQRAQDYTPEHVGQFLKEINLAHHVASFKEGEISGDMLLEATEEMLKEVGVTKAFERLKIKVYERDYDVANFKNNDFMLDA